MTSSSRIMMIDGKTVLQVLKIYSGCTASFLYNGDEIEGRERYYHPECKIFAKGRRDRHMDTAVMLALQDAGYHVRNLRYIKK